jgi:hypothetical protein
MGQGSPPLLHEDRLTLDPLGAMAREFDQLSAEDWAHLAGN